jgi:hypothetical protein
MVVYYKMNICKTHKWIHRILSIGTIVTVMIVTCESFSSGQKSTRYDLIDEMKNIYFQHKEWLQYKNCFPKSGCYEDDLCYSRKIDNICNYKILLDCGCTNVSYCTREDWVTVNPTDCDIDDSAIYSVFTLLTTLSFLFSILIVFIVDLQLHYFIIGQINIRRPYQLYILYIYSIIITFIAIIDYILRSNKPDTELSYYWRGIVMMGGYIGIAIYVDCTMTTVRLNLNNPNARGGTATRATIAHLPDVQEHVQVVHELVTSAVDPVATSSTQTINTVASVGSPTQTINTVASVVTPSIDQGDNKCLICCDKKRNILLLPCRHVCYCQECGTNPAITVNKCPFCRKNVDDVMKIYIP